MKIIDTTLTALLFSGCRVNSGVQKETIKDTAAESNDTGDSFPAYDTGSPDSSYETGIVDTSIDSGFYETGVYDSGSLDSGLRDSSDSGLSTAEDWCASTVYPESVPTVQLLPNRYALVDDDEYFETNNGSRSSPTIEDSVYTAADAHGCSCERILDCKPSGTVKDEYEFGCTEGTMKDWINQRAWATECLK
jgi:hypothetical protein